MILPIYIYIYIYTPQWAWSFFIASRYTDGNRKHLICTFEEVISSHLITIPEPKGNVMLERFNKVILRLLQVGILDLWFRDIKYTTFSSSAAQTILLTGEYVKLNLPHMQSAVYILLLGLVLSFIAFHSEILFCRNARYGQGSSVGIATDYGLDGLGIESRWSEIFRPSRPALGPTQHPVQWVPDLSPG